MALKILQIATAFSLGAGFIVSPVQLDSNSPFSIQSAFAKQGGNGGGNGNGNGASGSTGTESKKSTPKDKVRSNIKSNLEALGAAKKAVANAIKKVVATQGTAQQELEVYLQADVDLITAAAAIIAKEKALANDPGNPKLQKALISARLIFARANETVAFALVNYKKAVDAAVAAQASLEASEAAANAAVAKLKAN